jgi:transcriptional regulator with XRE-family HTH domain
MMEAKPLAETVGERMREIRQAHGGLQSDIVAAAKVHGLRWARSTVSTLENGGRGFTVEELLLLPLIMSDALAADVTLHDLLPHGSVRLSEEITLDEGAMRALLQGKALGKRYVDEDGRIAQGQLVARFLRSDEEDRRAAVRLGITPERVRAVSLRLWGQPLLDERNDRAEQHGTEESSIRSRQAIRGHTTRGLLDELRVALSQEQP